MNSKFITLTQVAEISAFVQHAMDCEYDILVKRGAYCVDGKSLMGVFSIDMSQGATVEYNGKDTKFVNYIESL